MSTDNGKLQERLLDFETAWEKCNFDGVDPLIDLEEFKALLIEEVKVKSKKNYSSYIMAKLKNHSPNSTPKVYIFKSKQKGTKVVQAQRNVSMSNGLGGIVSVPCPSIKCSFDFCSFTLTETFANDHGREIEEIYELLVKFPGYGKTFICISGPGVKVDKKKIAEFNAKPKGDRIVKQGAI